MAEKMRIQKAISDAGIMSRRKAEALVMAGKIKINGHVAQVGAAVDPARDHVTIEGRRVNLNTKGEEKRYIMLNKPRGYVTTLSDEMDRKCITELLEDIPVRVYPVGRLDKVSEGLLILTNDGAFANALMHPRYHVPKNYRVTVREKVTDKQQLQLMEGVEIDGGKTQPAEVEVLVRGDNRSVLSITIYEGRNRQIRKMCEAVGLSVIRLKRVAVGPVKLGMLKPGAWRDLTHVEVSRLLRAANKASAQAVQED